MQTRFHHENSSGGTVQFHSGRESTGMGRAVGLSVPRTGSVLLLGGLACAIPPSIERKT
jgi:hypothetical protein